MRPPVPGYVFSGWHRWPQPAYRDPKTTLRVKWLCLEVVHDLTFRTITIDDHRWCGILWLSTFLWCTQGIILGPMLYLVYTSSVSNAVASLSAVEEQQYSDDHQLRGRFDSSTCPSNLNTKEAACLVFSSCLTEVERTLTLHRLK